MKAGYQFNCTCCKETKDEDEASFDQYLGGPVCRTCEKNLMKGVAWMKPAGIDGQLTPSHITNWNCNRLNDL